MRRHRARAHRRAGFLLLFTLFVTAILLTFSASSLSRSMTELSAANRTAELTAALHTADGCIDDSLSCFRKTQTSDVRAMLQEGPPRPLNCPSLTPKVYSNACTVLNVQYLDSDNPFNDDANRIVRVTAAAQHGSTTQRVTATVRLDLTAPYVYPFAVAGATIDMDGNAQFGESDRAAETVIYVQGPPGASGAYETSNSNDVYAALIAFHDNLPIAALCPNCSDPTIFHPDINTGLPPMIVTNYPLQPDLQIDLKPYYDQAVATGHVITSNAAFNNTTLTGVYYVECGVEVTFSGSVSIQGTFVHEGCGGDIRVNEHAEVSFDSTSGSGQFAPGMAIIGAPDLDIRQSAIFDVKGVVIGSGARMSLMSKAGVIEGSLIAVADTAWSSYPDMMSGPGPGTNSLITFPLSVLQLKEGKVLFSATRKDGQEVEAPGVQASLRMWQAQ